MAKEAVLDLICDQATFLEFLESRLRFRISTGDHDALAVPIEELGSGLQSVLDLAFQNTHSPSENTELIIAAEEPEAFLHPSAQRSIATQLLSREEAGRRIILTTHSPIVVDEARFGDVVLCRNHSFYEPALGEHIDQEDINTSLLSGFGAEMVFGTSILLVEGEGDRQFFERLRRRIAVFDASGVLDSCFVVPVGSKSRFCPWLQLLNSYGDAADRPIRFLVAADGDASADVRTGFRNARYTIKNEVLGGMGNITAAMNGGNVTAWRAAVDETNRLAFDNNSPLHFLKLDLEEAMLSRARTDLIGQISDKVLWDDQPDRDEVMRRLGAKGYGGENGRKDVYLRAFIGNLITPVELSKNVRLCLRRWFGNACSDGKAQAILNAFKNNR